MATPTSGTSEIGNHILCTCDHVLYMHLDCVYLHKRRTHIKRIEVFIFVNVRRSYSVKRRGEVIR